MMTSATYNLYEAYTIYKIRTESDQKKKRRDTDV